MKRFSLVALVAALLFSMVTSASATELKVRGNLDVYGMWSANLNDHSSNSADGDNYATTQRMRAYFDYVANENLKAVLGFEIDNVWGASAADDWGTDGKGNLEIKHAYMDFMVPDTTVGVQAGLQYVALPSVFGNPVFDDDAAAITVGAQINDMVGITVGYTRGLDKSDSFTGDTLVTDGADDDDIDAAMLIVPLTFDGFSITPYFAYAWIGEGTDDKAQSSKLNSDGTITVTPSSNGALADDGTVWVLGANAELTMFDPLTFAADLIYGEGEDDDYETKGWYAALAASYKMDFMTATLFTTYATGGDEDADEDDFLPTLAEGWGISPYVGGVRAFSTSWDSWGSGALSSVSSSTIYGDGRYDDGTGLWTVGLVLDKISFVEKLSHNLVIAYAMGTSDEDSDMAFTEEDDLWEVYLVNTYMIYENLAAINELGYFQASSEDYEDATGDDLDSSYFATIGFQYKF